MPETPEKASDPPHWEGETKLAGGLRGPRRAGHRRQPAADDGDGPGHLRLVTAFDALELVKRVVERVAARRHEALEIGARVGPGAVIDGEHRAHVGMDHEPREDPQHVVEVVRARTAATLGVGHRHDTVHTARGSSCRLLRRVAGEPVRSGGDREDHHEVAGADAAPAAAPVPFEGPVRFDPLDLLARAEGPFVQIEGLDRVGEVRLRGKLEVDVALGERLQDLRVAGVLAGSERTDRNPEGKSPREEPGAVRDRLADEAVPLEHGVGKLKRAVSVLDVRSRVETPGRDRDVVPGGRHPRHPVE